MSGEDDLTREDVERLLAANSYNFLPQDVRMLCRALLAAWDELEIVQMLSKDALNGAIRSADECSRLEADNARLRAALEPFASYARRLDDEYKDPIRFQDSVPLGLRMNDPPNHSPCLRDCRAAREALMKEQSHA